MEKKRKMNCWEYKQCGREPDGVNEKALGACSAAVEINATGIHCGKNGGRACWAIAGTLCGGKSQGSFAEKVGACEQCDFYKKVKSEEGHLKDKVDILYQLKYPDG